MRIYKQGLGSLVPPRGGVTKLNFYLCESLVTKLMLYPTEYKGLVDFKKKKFSKKFSKGSLVKFSK